MAEISLGVKVWGDVGELIKGLKTGGKGVDEFAQKSGGKFAELSRAFQKAGLIYKNTAAQFGTNSPEARDAMKNFSQLKAEVDNINSKMRPKKGMFSDLKDELGGLAMGFVGVSAVVGGVVAMFQQGIQGALEEERATKKLTFALNGSATATERMLRFKEQMMASTLFSEDDIMGAVSMGLSLGRTEQQTQKMVTAAMGLANVTGADLNTAMMQLSGTYEGNIGKLGKLASELKGLTAEQLANGDAVDILNDKFGKFASEGLNTAAGSVIQMKKYWGEALEEIGFKSMDFFQGIKTGFTAITAMMGGGVNIKATANQKTSNQRAQVQAVLDNIAAMREQAKADQTRNMYLEKLNANQDKVTKGLTQEQIATKALKEEKDQLNKSVSLYASLMRELKKGAGQGGGGGMISVPMFNTGLSAPGTMSPISNPSVTNDVGVKPSEEMLNLQTAIEGAANALQGLGAGFSRTFAAIGNIMVKFKEGFKGDWKAATSAALELAAGAVEMISGLFTDASARRVQEFDDQYNAQRESIEKSKMSEGAKKKALDKLDADSAKRKKELMRQNAKDQKTAAVMQAIVAGALAVVQALSAGPVIGIVLAALVGAMAAVQVANIIAQPLPALAGGGLAMSPTLALVGDNKNARIDPEVIAPLSKLKDMLFGGVQQGGGTLEARVKGEDLLFVMNRAQINANRRY